MAEQSSKELIRGLFELKELARVPFIPWVCSFAAQLEQIQVKAMLSDAGLLSRALINTQKLFGYDAIVNVFDPSLEAEACGCKIDWGKDESLPEVTSHPLSEGAAIGDLDFSDLEKRGRLPVVLEATKRLNIIKGKEVAIIGMITGPLTLAKHLKGESFIDSPNQDIDEAADIISTAGSISLKMCRIYCELGVDAVVIAEEMPAQLNPAIFQEVVSSLRSIWNVSRFYNVHSLILSKGCRDEHVEPILDLQADGVAVSGELDFTRVKDGAQKRNCCFARSIPSTSLLGSVASSGDSAADCLSSVGKGFFLSTEWDVPYATNVNNMHEVMRIIRENKGS